MKTKTLGAGKRLKTIPARAMLILLTVISLSITSPLFGQGKLSGVVLGQDKQSLTNATVALLSATDSSLVKGALTNSDGIYRFENLAPGGYIVAASFTGMKQMFSTSFQLTNNTELVIEPITLTEKENQLGAVFVSAKKPLFEQKIDRMVINVAGSITSAGSTALDVLMRSPGITVDQQNNTLTMNGKDGIVVMMNGKISRMPISAVVQMLAGMSSSDIEKIELITTPPANFDAEGNAGYINIVLKTNNLYGTNGNYIITGGYGKSPVGAASIIFNHRSGSWNIFGDYSFARTAFKTNFNFYRKVQQASKSLETFAENPRDAFRLNHAGRIGIDLQLHRKTTIGAMFSMFSNLYSMEGINTSNIFLNGRLDTTIVIENYDNHPIKNYTANINLTHHFSTTEKITLNGDHVYFNDANSVDYENRYYNGTGAFMFDELTRSAKETPIRFWVGSADYTKQLSEKIALEGGLKTTLSRFTNDVSVERKQQNNWKMDEGLTSINFLKESIFAAYTSFGVQFSKRTSGKMGLRYEYTNSNLSSLTAKNIVDRHYGNLFPTLFLSHSFNEIQSMNVSYTRRITRPTFNDMAPFVYFVDPNTLFSGNPALQPAIASSIKADYLIKRFIFSANYTYEQSPITNYAPRVDPATNRQTLAAENQRNKKIAAVNISLPIRFTSWWNMQTNLSGIWQELNAIYNNEPLRIAQKTVNINSTQILTLPKDYTVELRGYAQSGGLFGIYQMKAYGTMDFGIQKKFANNKSTLRLNVTDVFGAPRFKPVIDLPEQNLVVKSNLQFTNRFVRLTFTRSFGNSQVKSNRERTTASEEERRRVNTN